MVGRLDWLILCVLLLHSTHLEVGMHRRTAFSYVSSPDKVDSYLRNTTPGDALLGDGLAQWLDPCRNICIRRGGRR